MMKRCSKCRERKSYNEFYSNGPGRGKRSDCAACNRAANRDRYYGENRQRILTRMAHYNEQKRSQIHSAATALPEDPGHPKRSAEGD